MTAGGLVWMTEGTDGLYDIGIIMDRAMEILRIHVER
jgi:hypothetical protein